MKTPEQLAESLLNEGDYAVGRAKEPIPAAGASLYVDAELDYGKVKLTIGVGAGSPKEYAFEHDHPEAPQTMTREQLQHLANEVASGLSSKINRLVLDMASSRYFKPK